MRKMVSSGALPACINLVISDPMPGLKHPLRVRVGQGEPTENVLSNMLVSKAVSCDLVGRTIM